MKASKIASIVYYVLLALSAVVLVLFFCVGFGNMESLPSGYYKSPQCTDLLMYWMYALAAICAVCTIVGAVTAKGGKVDSNMPKWGKVLSQAGLWMFIPVLVITYFLGDDTAIRLGGGELYEKSFIFYLHRIVRDVLLIAS
jgi:Na+/H+-translocating membrane pyrophosphatase